MDESVSIHMNCCGQFALGCRREGTNSDAENLITPEVFAPLEVEHVTHNTSLQIALVLVSPPKCVVSRSVTVTPFLPCCCWWSPSRWGGSWWGACYQPVGIDLLQSRFPAGSGPCNQEEKKEMVTTHWTQTHIVLLGDCGHGFEPEGSAFHHVQFTPWRTGQNVQWIALAQLPGRYRSSMIKHQHCERKQQASWTGQMTSTQDNADDILRFSYCQQISWEGQNQQCAT